MIEWFQVLIGWILGILTVMIFVMIKFSLENWINEKIEESTLSTGGKDE